jgi:23S rRNA pseudouridine1911/1915/1917 synthase
VIPFLHARWPVFFEDNHLLVVFKPAGLLSQGGATAEANLLDLSKAWIKARYGKPGRVFLGLVHRLDRPVAGVMLFARTSKSAARLSEQIRNRSLRKVYLAVVEGRMPSEAGEMVHHLERRTDAVRIVSAPCPGSREARLAFRVEAVSGGRSLVEIDLKTGRKHQIRVQLAHAGCPILGDVRYGASAPLPAGRIALLARQITFVHPTRQEPLSFTSPLPAGWPWPHGEPPDEAPFWNYSDHETACGGHFKP